MDTIIKVQFERIFYILKYQDRVNSEMTSFENEDPENENPLENEDPLENENPLENEDPLAQTTDV